MEILKLISFLLTFISIQTFGQEKSTKVNDFNGDGVSDTLESYYDSGSGFGGKYATLHNGKTDDVYELNTYGCFCQIKKVILIPAKLKDPENYPFLEAMSKNILPKKKNLPDASLQWIINSTYSYKRLTDNRFFDLILNPCSNWEKGKLELPSTYYIDLKKDFVDIYYADQPEIPEGLSDKENKWCLIYYGHNHYQYKELTDSIILIDSYEKYKAYRTAHGVLIKKGNLFKWVFVTDIDLTGAPGKLRWESINNLKLIKAQS